MSVKTVDVGAWKSHKESWLENLERYRKEMRDIDNPYQINKMKLVSNNIDICLLNIDICTMQIKIAELQQENTKIKTKM